MKPLHQSGSALLRLSVFAAIAPLTLHLTAQERNQLPLDAQNARAEYLAQRKAGLLTLNQRYLESLKSIQEGYTRAGHLDQAVAIKAEMDRILAEVAELKGGSPTTPAPADTSAAPIPEGEVISLTIEAKNEEGVPLPQLKKGDQIVLQYQSGAWKSHGVLGTEKPDAERLAHGDANRLAIFSKKSQVAKLRALAMVPPGTAEKPFEFTVPDDFYSIVLRINDDPDGSWEGNPGSVVYRVQIKKAQ